MQLLKLTAMAALVLTLSACQSLFQPDYRKPLAVSGEKWEHIKPGCQGEGCPLLNVDTVHFADEPALDQLIQKQLLQMTRLEPDAPLAPSLPAYEQAFLAKAQARHATYLQAKVREQHDGLVVIELSSYLDTGGAHGMPGRGFINWSRQQHKALTLPDMLVSGEEPAFWLAAQEAWKGWLNGLPADQRQAMGEQWPFQKTANIALTANAVVLKYDVYSIAPYAMGHPELKIDYRRLNGVLKAELMPGR